MTCNCAGTQHVVCTPRWRVPTGRIVFRPVKMPTMAEALADGLVVTPHVEHVRYVCVDDDENTNRREHMHSCLCEADDDRNWRGVSCRGSETQFIERREPVALPQ